VTERIRLDEVAEVRLGNVVDKPANPDAIAPPSRVFGLPEFQYTARAKPRFIAQREDDPPPVELQKGDVVIGLTGRHIGDTVLIGKRFDGAALARDCAVIRLTPGGPMISKWLYAWTRTQDYRGQVEREVVGATIQRLTPRALRGLSVPVFTSEDQARLAEVAAAFDAALDAAKQTVAQLEVLRDKKLDLDSYRILRQEPESGSEKPAVEGKPKFVRKLENSSGVEQ
jgi:restriction endonuclease S subunit